MDPQLSYIQEIIASQPVVLFLKGSAAQPHCGFSKTVVQILKHMGVSFLGVDILEPYKVPGSEECKDLRHDLKAFSQWPTFPQLYSMGAFIGGCDIVCQLYQDHKLQDMLPPSSPSSPQTSL